VKPLVPLAVQLQMQLWKTQLSEAHEGSSRNLRTGGTQMSLRIIGSTALASLALAIGVAAQAPASTQPQTQTPARPPQAANAPAVTIEGCLVREKDVAGRKPNIVERQGVMEDYILTSTKIVKGSAPTASTRRDQPTGTAGTAAGSRMYQVKGIDDAKLQALVGKRVQVEGTLADLDEPATPSPGAEDLADIESSSIRQVSGECPSKP
jgi:hypothetical protein